MKHSCANVFCKREGDRSGPVKNGDAMVCVRTRSLFTVPAPPHVPATQPAIYDGAALALFPKRPPGAVATRGATRLGSKPASMPVTTFPGESYPGRPPSEGSHAS